MSGFQFTLVGDERSLSSIGNASFNSSTIGVIVILFVLSLLPVFLFLYSAIFMGTNQQIKLVLGKAIFSEEDEIEEELPVPPLVLCSFREVKYRVPLGEGNEKHILSGINAYFTPGTLTAVMGPSGCGKSTLLDILAGQKSFGTISGDIRINGASRTDLFRRATAYVQQFDVLYPNLTPKETLYFVSELRLDGKISSKMKYKIVLKALEDLGIEHVADTRIGNGESGGGLSGGQKRRVTVGIELVTGPGLLFLDEPTSGLDAFGSLELAKVLRKLADDGRTIACTIHQPRADIFSLFDKLLLIKFGRTMYFGDINGIFPYFESLGVKVDYSVNPADFIVDLTRDLSPEEKVEEQRLVAMINTHRAARGDAVDTISEEVDGIDLDSLCDEYEKNHLNHTHDRVLRSIGSGTYEKMPPLLEEIWNQHEASKYSTSFTHQVHYLVIRAVVNDFRNTAYITGHWVIGAVMMLFYGLLYSNIAAPSISTQTFYSSNLESTSSCFLNNTYMTQYPQNPTTTTIVECGEPSLLSLQYLFVRISLLYQLMSAAFFAENTYVSSMYLEKRMFFREHSSHGYSSGAYHMAWGIRLFFAAGVKSLVLPPFAYFLCKLEVDIGAYLIFIFVYGAMSCCGSAFALLCSAAGTSLGVSTNVYVLINIVCQNLSGYFIPLMYVGWWFRWFMFMNFYYWAIYGTQMGQLVATLKNTDLLPSYRDELVTLVAEQAWTAVIIVLMYAVAIHVLAFIVTWLTHANTSATFEETVFSDNADEIISEPSTLNKQISPGPGAFSTMLGTFQHAQLTSTRNIVG